MASFDIDTSPTCMLGEIGVRAAAGKASVEWKAVPGAGSYELKAYSHIDGRLIASQETRTPGEQLDLRGEGAVVSVRPACASGLGEAVYRVVPAG
jgi:hypothetical protein